MGKSAHVDILIVGGGASGMMAAIAAAHARPSLKIAILERHSILGRKILATGNGTCNISNIRADENAFGCFYFSSSGPDKFGEKDYQILAENFFKTAFSAFGPQDSLDFFAGRGLIFDYEEDGRIYPHSRQAVTVRNVLEDSLANLGVLICRKCEAEDVVFTGKDFVLKVKESELRDFKDRAGNIRPQVNEKSRLLTERILSAGEIRAKVLVLAAGGKASPALSSDGLGYNLARKLGHGVSPLFPAVVRMSAKSKLNPMPSGVRLQAKLALFENISSLTSYAGEEDELLFTDTGLSGPGILNLTGKVRSEQTVLRADLMPAMTQEELRILLGDRRASLSHYRVRDFLEGIMPAKLGRALVKAFLPEEADKHCEDLTDHDLGKLAAAIKNLVFTDLKGEGWMEAQVTAGGVYLTEVFADDFSSKICSGLYLTGEILDLTGDCGGYNLQLAWTGGYLAGKAAAESLD